MEKLGGVVKGPKTGSTLNSLFKGREWRERMRMDIGKGRGCGRRWSERVEASTLTVVGVKVVDKGGGEL